MYTNTDMSSWVDLCLNPFANLASGNGDNNDDVYCANCPVGPFLDFTYLVRSHSLLRCFTLVCAMRALDKAPPPQKYDTNAFDLPCKPGFKVPSVYYWTSQMKNISSAACYLSLNYVYDPIYAFEKQFPAVTSGCKSPIQCASTMPSGRRHLLAGASKASSGTGISPSDLRLKSNILPTGRFVAGLLAEYTWQWNDAAKALHLDGYPTVGVMAQEAQALFPHAVSTAADGYLRVDYDMLLF